MRVEELHVVDSQMMVDDGGVERWIDPRGTPDSDRDLFPFGALPLVEAGGRL